MNGYQQTQIKHAMDSHNLTEWETDFIYSLAERDNEYELSEKQNHILNRISEKIEE